MQCRAHPRQHGIRELLEPGWQPVRIDGLRTTPRSSPATCQLPLMGADGIRVQQRWSLCHRVKSAERWERAVKFEGRPRCFPISITRPNKLHSVVQCTPPTKEDNKHATGQPLTCPPPVYVVSAAIPRVALPRPFARYPGLLRPVGPHPVKRSQAAAAPRAQRRLKAHHVPCGLAFLASGWSCMAPPSRLE